MEEQIELPQEQCAAIDAAIQDASDLIQLGAPAELAALPLRSVGLEGLAEGFIEDHQPGVTLPPGAWTVRRC
jgi:hypothetical protein